MKFYICYANENRIDAIRLDRELRANGGETCFFDRGESELLVDSMEQIMNGIKACDAFVILHTESTNLSVLSQIEITYARNRNARIYLVKRGYGKVSDAILFELGRCPVITGAQMSVVAQKLIKKESEVADSGRC